MRRSLGIAAGVLTHALFAYTLWHLVPFLWGSAPRVFGSLGIDFLLAGQFGLLHSILLHRTTRKRLEPFISGPFYGLFFCVATSLQLLPMMAFWHSSPLVVWQFTGLGRAAMLVGFVGSWALLHYSLWLNGLGYQTGFTPWWNWVRGRPSRPRPFQVRGVYRLLRHPTYLSFMGTVWMTPTVTLDRAILIAIWTSYIFIGSWLKDRRLEFYLGEYYREYETRVPGYPGMIFGPLAKIRLPRQEQPAPAAPAIAADAAAGDSSSIERGIQPASGRAAIMNQELQLSSR